MADVKGAYTGDFPIASAARFTGHKGAFILGGDDPIVLIRYYALRGWDPALGSWEAWTSTSPEGLDNPSGQPLTHVTSTPYDRRGRYGES
ncbi:MAG: hypothetical protein DRJ03_27870 [Chloroflexi bacterium]|nr:MAG: hypothetical protein DRJ03_27870 [Chloroflexota bacterium]